MSSAIQTALTGLRAFSIKMDVSANNLANVNTDDFKSSRVLLREAYPAGVTVTIQQDRTPGARIGGDPLSGEARELSNVNLHEEIAGQIITRYAYEAGLVTVREADKMEEALMDILA